MGGRRDCPGSIGEHDTGVSEVTGSVGEARGTIDAL